MVSTAQGENWMRALAARYERRRAAEPNRPLLVVFDIDGTILDPRHMLLEMLRAYDDTHATEHAAGLEPHHLNIHESRLGRWLATLDIDPAERDRIRAYHQRYRWSSTALLRAHQPFHGVLEVIRWFQLQPGTDVALNSGRPEALRLDTLRSLNELGRRFRVSFRDELLQMSPYADERRTAAAKVEGIRRLRERGYGIVAVVDNEPDNLAAVIEANPDEDILPLHAATIFRSKRVQSPAGTVRGNTYDITALISARHVPRHIEFIWSELASECALQRFLQSEIRWGECVVNRGARWRALLSSGGLPLPYLVETIAARQRRLKITVPDADMIDEVLRIAAEAGLQRGRLRIAVDLQHAGEAALRVLSRHSTEAEIEVAAPFLLPLANGLPAAAADVVERLKAAGVSRFALPWIPAALPATLDLMDRLDAPAHIGPVANLESFLQASLLSPQSLSSSFDFAGWIQGSSRGVSRRA
ncbi:MAG TPA: HAD family hydrolase [Gammaproteobacteria bacterium]|nr:HAD family hydrolase [Gammaproteobacteria bacterium]